MLVSSLSLKLHQAAATTTIRLLLLLFITRNIHRATAASSTTYKVTPSGKWTSSSGYSSKSKVYSLPDALAIARAGDTVWLSDGTYHDRVDSLRAGKRGSPIKIKGGAKAVIKADSPSVRIRHSWILLQASVCVLRIVLGGVLGEGVQQ